MATYPGLVQLIRMLGRADALAALGADGEPHPDALTDDQRERLVELAEAHLDSMAAELVDEAAASDDVTDGTSAAAFVDDCIAAFADLVTPQQIERVKALVGEAVADWN